MLDKNSIVAASSHVYDLTKRGFKLSAKIDTPLYEMTRLSIIAEQTSNEVYPKDFTADDLATNFNNVVVVPIIIGLRTIRAAIAL